MRPLPYVINQMMEIVEKQFPPELIENNLQQLNSLLSSAAFSAPENIQTFWNELSVWVNGVVPQPSIPYRIKPYQLSVLCVFLDKPNDEVIGLFNITVDVSNDRPVVEVTPEEKPEQALPDWYVKPVLFHCPKCGCARGFFGTFTYRKVMDNNPKYAGKGYKEGDSIGHCNANHHLNNGCDYEWVRTKESDEKHFH